MDSIRSLTRKAWISSQFHKIARSPAWQPLQVSPLDAVKGWQLLTSPIGYPIATMPLGVLKDFGRPFGLAIMARAGREDILFTFMSAFEAEFPKRAIPSLLLGSDNGDGVEKESRI
jgi:Asp-tRNA(Asn)/Glu-tRNA(Gln) amidotransferase A subunit family amidase